VEFSVLDYENSIAFYDRMFGWLGYRSFWTLDIAYRSTYYVARLPFVHSYIGIQPAHTGDRLDPQAHATGIHHIALWARSRREVDRFHAGFLVGEGVTVTDAPQAYPVYAPGYYAVFFLDSTGIRWELAHLPYVPMPWQIAATLRAVGRAWRNHPEISRHPARAMWRELPGRKTLK